MNTEVRVWFQVDLMQFRLIAYCVFSLLLAATDAVAAKRIALLIGNQDYARQVGALSNPVNDVNLIAASLRKIGFEDGDVRIVRNGTRRAILRAIDAHAEALKAAGPDAIGFLYYSGHGAANKRNRRNYLIPVGVKRLDGSVWYDAIPLDTIVSTLSDIAVNAAHFVVFDACRNLLNMPTKGAKGFVPVSTRRGMLIAFSTDPGETASDEGKGSGPYAAALAAELVRPGIHHLDLFQNVKERVYRQTSAQVPWTRDGMLQRVFLGGHSVPKPQFLASWAARDWQLVKDTNNPEALRAFARRYKGTVYADMALAIVAPLKQPSRACSGVNVKLAKGKSVCIKAGSGKSFKACENCPEMLIVPAGRFTMGSPGNEPQRDKDEAQIHVTIAKPFAVGKFEVTRGEFAAFVKASGHFVGNKCRTYEGNKWKERIGRSFRKPGFSQNDTHPVVCVNWKDAQAYVEWLNTKLGLSGAQRYRLPSETEWEYVARASTTSPFWWGSSIKTTLANYNGNYVYKGGGSKGKFRKRTVSVDSFKANVWGLHNVHGNVYEWTEDCWNDSNSGNPGNGSARTTGKCKRRIIRGGSFGNNPKDLRSALRHEIGIGRRSFSVGFRVVRMLTP